MDKSMQKNLLIKLNKKLEAEKYINADGPRKVVLDASCSRKTWKFIDLVTVTKHQMLQLVALSQFLKENPEVTQEDLNELLKTKFFQFKFLRRVNNMLPDFLLELKNYGARSVALYYANRVRVNKQIQNALP